MLHLANVTFPEIAALVTLVGAVVAGIAAVRKLGPEKASLFISSAQGAAVIMDNLISTLREEVDRCRLQIAELQADNERLTAENDVLRKEASGLRRQHGRRRGEGSG